MTSQQSAQLDAAWADYQEKVRRYQGLQSDFNKYNIPGADAGFTAAVITPLRAQVDAAKIAMDQSLVAFNVLKDSISASEQAAFNAANPQAAIQIAQAQAQAAVDAAKAVAEGKAKEAEAKAKADIEAQTTTFAAQNKKAILYVSIGLVVVLVIGFAYLKFRKKLQP